MNSAPNNAPPPARSLVVSPRASDLLHQHNQQQLEYSAEMVEQIILNCNQFAIEHMRDFGAQDVLELLKKSEYLLEKNVGKLEPPTRNRLLDMTYNNLGCYYKK